VTEQQPDVWASRDLPVLVEITRRLDGTRDALSAHQLVDSTRLPEADVDKAIRNLARGKYIVLDGPWNPTVIDITERALREAKLWPTPETALDRMIAALEHIADNTDEDPDTRSWARRTIDVMKSAGGRIGIGVATAVITGGIT
jgi:hypothetical protein